jgi:hypothetical protein
LEGDKSNLCKTNPPMPTDKKEIRAGKEPSDIPPFWHHNHG